jgi:hypothetical protein
MEYVNIFNKPHPFLCIKFFKVYHRHLHNVKAFT